MADNAIPRITSSRVYGTFARWEMIEATSITVRKAVTRTSAENMDL
jgi:hypothetical protein